MSHYYNLDGGLVDPWEAGALPSPSTILERLRSYEYEALVERIGEEAADELMKTAAARGTRVHEATHRLEMGDDGYLDSVEPEEQGYVQGYENWRDQYALGSLVDSELFVVSDRYKYAGRLDRVFELDGKLWIVDVKTGQDNVRHGLQLKFYQQAYYEMTGKKARMGVLALDPKRACGYRNSRSPYGLQEYKEPLAAVLAHLQVYKWWARKKPINKPKEELTWTP